MSGAGERARIVVVGSINLDLVARVPRLPRPGETVTGRTIGESHGGKGANQAVSVARLGAECVMVGRVGGDGFGGALREGLAREGVGVEAVTVTPGVSSGVALIHVDDAGQNTITVIPGANGRLTPADVRASRAQIAGAGAMVVQLETPMETVEAAVQEANRLGVPTLLDPAPAPVEGLSLPAVCLAVDVLSPNQTEAEALTGIAVDSLEGARAAATRLQKHGVKAVVIKLGDQGAYYREAGGAEGHVAAHRVAVVDTTAAGDAFTAALAVRLAEGSGLAEAVRFGCAAGAIAVTRQGAQAAMPSRAEVEALLVKRGTGEVGR